jgi:superfamily II DNA helicase RecQ
MRRFKDNPDNAREKQAEYRTKLEDMTDAQLYAECRSAIWLSAYANNNPGSCYHWQCDACYDESQKRDDKGIYSRAHKAEVAAAS